LEQYSFIQGSAFADVINVTGATGISLGYGSYVSGGAGNDTISAADGARDFRGEGGDDTLNGGELDDYLYGQTGNDTLNGNLGADQLEGNENDDTLNGGGGNDTLYGGGGNDTANGGDGADTAYGEDHDDTLNGDAGDDTLVGGSGADHLIGGAGNDRIYGREINSDRRASDDGLNILEGGVGDDYLQSGERTTTTLNGGDGNDYIRSHGIDTIDGGAGDDTVELSDWSGSTSFQGGAGVDTFVVYTFSVGPVLSGFSAANGFERIGFFDQRSGFNGTADANVFDFGALEGLDGSLGAIVYGNGGDDILIGTDSANARDHLNGGDGNDIVRGNAGDDDLAGHDGNDIIRGGAGSDNISGGEGDDALYGGAGDDTIAGGGGFDTLYLTGAQSDYSVLVWRQTTIYTDLRAGSPDGVTTVYNDERSGDFVENIVYNYVPNTPVITGLATGVTFLESAVNLAPQILDAAVTFADDSDTLNGATLRLSGQLAADVVGIRNQGGGAGQIGFAAGVVSFGGTQIGTATGGAGSPLVVTLNGSASPTALEALIENLTYATASDAPVASRTLTLTVTASGGLSDSESITVNVTPVNDAPAGTNGSANLTPGAARAFTIADFGYSDVDGNAFAGVRLTSLPTAGTITLNGAAVTAGRIVSTTDIAAGRLVFTAAANASGTTYGAFRFQVQDNGGTANGGANLDASSNLFTFNVVASGNVAPSGADGSINMSANSQRVLVASEFGFSDSDGHNLAAVRIASLPSAGALTLNGTGVTAGQTVSVADINAGRLVFTASVGASGTNYASFTFQVQDSGGTANGGVDLDPTANRLTINVAAPQNVAPSGTNGAATFLEDGTKVFAGADFGFNDTDGNALAGVRITTLPAAGFLRLNGVEVTAGQTVSAAAIAAGGLVFTPAANASGATYATFTFQVQDNGGTANGGVDLDPTPNTFTLNVTPVNDAPAGTTGAVTILEDAPRTLAAADFGFTDTEGHAFAGVVVSSLATAGTLRLNGVPVTAGQFVTAADLAAGLLVFTPAANANGVDYARFTFAVRDAGGTANGGVDTDATPNTLTLNVTPVNDAPSGLNGSTTILEDRTKIFAASDFGFTDVEGDALAGVRITTLPAAGALRLNGVAVTAGQTVSAADLAAGLLVFTPAANASGANYASLNFQVQDTGGTANGGANLDPSANTLTLSVTPVNDAPRGTDTTVTMLEDSARTLAAADFGYSDLEGHAFAGFVVVALPAAGALRLSGAALTVGQFVTAADISAGLLVFTPAPDASRAAYASWGFRVRDAGGTLNGGVDTDPGAKRMTFSVTAVNDAPSGANGAATILEDASKVFGVADFGFTDVDGHTLQEVVVTSLPTAGALRLNGAPVTAGQAIAAASLNSGLLVFTPAPNANGTNYASFTFQVRDNGGTLNGGVNTDTTPNTYTVNVTPVNDAPTLGGGVPTATLLEANGVSAGVNAATATALVAADVDAGDSASFDLTGWTQVGATSSYTRDGTFGVATLNTQTGVIGYALNNADPDTQALNNEDLATEAFTVTVRDTAGATASRTVTFSIRGAREVVDGTVLDDQLNGSGFGDAMNGGDGDDVLSAMSGADTLFGGEGDDLLNAGSGNDRLDGGADADTLLGGSGADILRGGEGRDDVSGGSGADRFVFGDGDFSSAVRDGSDLIRDFVRADGDKIDLSLVDANTIVAGDQAFSFLGSGAFTGVAGQLRTETSGTTLFLLGDQDGDGTTDFVVQLWNVSSLVQTDFML
jgi:VCBS repeat-containing protein